MSFTASTTLTPETSRPSSLVGAPLSEQPILDHSHLKPGHKASLLSHTQTLELYRQNAKKTNDPDIQHEFAVFMITASNAMTEENSKEKQDLIKEGISLLKKLADRGHAESQFYLAECFANGIGTSKNKLDFDKAFPLFVQAAKHHHQKAAYYAAMCYEQGWGCRKDAAKALQFYRKAASANHPGAMYRLGIAELNGEMGLSKNPRDGVKWLKRSEEAATEEFPHALHELAELHEKGIENVFVDIEYAVQLLVRAADLNYAPSAFKLGECYEYGKMGCQHNPALSIHYYTIAAQQNHPEACFALTAWYLVGSPGLLPQSDTEAYLWAQRAADQSLAKAEYAVGYFKELGIGTKKDPLDAEVWYRRAAEHGDKRAQQRLKGIPIDDKNKKDCVIC